jgi:hypothetical protein
VGRLGSVGTFLFGTFELQIQTNHLDSLKSGTESRSTWRQPCTCRLGPALLSSHLVFCPFLDRLRNICRTGIKVHHQPALIRSSSGSFEMNTGTASIVYTRLEYSFAKWRERKISPQWLPLDTSVNWRKRSVPRISFMPDTERWAMRWATGKVGV